MVNSLKSIKADILVPNSLEVAEKLTSALDNKAKTRLYVAMRFNTIFLVSSLDRVIDQVPDSFISPALRINSLEEKGLIEAYGSDTHEDCRNDLASAIGIELNPVIPKEMEEVIKSSSVHFLLGILFYIEYQIPDEYESLLNRIRQFYPKASEDDLFHLLNHIEHDQHHFEDIFSRLSVSTGLNIELFRKGIEFMHQRRLTLIELVDSL